MGGGCCCLLGFNCFCQVKEEIFSGSHCMKFIFVLLGNLFLLFYSIKTCFFLPLSQIADSNDQITELGPQGYKNQFQKNKHSNLQN